MKYILLFVLHTLIVLFCSPFVMLKRLWYWEKRNQQMYKEYQRHWNQLKNKLNHYY
jgi:hypothetical protein